MPSSLPPPQRALVSGAIALTLLLAFLLLSGPTLMAAPPVAPPPAEPADAPWTVNNVKVSVTALGAGAETPPWPAIAAFSGAANLVAAWADLHSPPGDLYAARSADGGATWISQRIISTDTMAASLAQSAPVVSLAVSGTNTVHAAWLNATGTMPPGSLFYLRSTDGGVTWPGSPVSITTLFGPAYSPVLASRGANVYLAWQANLQLKMARSTNGGSTWLGATPVYTPGGSDTLWPDLSLISDLGGNLHLAWDQSTNFTGQDVCYSRSTNQGVTWSTATCPVSLISATLATNPDLAVDPGNGWLHLVYVDDSSTIATVKHRQSTDGGATWSAATTVSDGLYPATEPSIVMSGTHTLFVVWTDGPGRSGSDTDVYYARSTNDGATWGAPGRVNDLLVVASGVRPAATLQDQIHPFLAAGNNGPRAIWSDYRNNVWDIYSAAISRTCSFPLLGVTLDGPAAPLPGSTWYTATLNPPEGADPPISYNWAPAPATGQGTANARYAWPVPGTYTIAVTASNCGGGVSASRAITVQCNLPLTAVSIDPPPGPPYWQAIANTPVMITGTTTPAAPNPTVVYTWSPPPVSGQGTLTATYQWSVVGTHPVTLTAANCGGTVTGTTSVVVTDTLAPLWGVISPAGWITNTLSPSVSIRVTDTQSGLDVSTLEYAYSTNGGGAWVSSTLSTAAMDGITTSLAITAANVPFNRDAGRPVQTQIRFFAADMAGNPSASLPFSVTIDTLPPVNPATVVVVGRSPSVWSAGFSAVVTWTAATDASSGVAGYSYLWSQDATALPPATISSTGVLSAATLIPGYGQHWYFHVRARDVAGNWSPTATHQGPYWVGNAPPAFLTLDPESSGQGAEVVLTGFGWDSMVTATVYFTSTGGVSQTLGQVQTSWDGTFQAVATVPTGATIGASHGFQVAQPGGKTARSKFTVTPGMSISLLTPSITPKQAVLVQAGNLNPQGQLVLETTVQTSGGPEDTYSGPFPLYGSTVITRGIFMPTGAISGTYQVTVTNRVDGYVVQKSAVSYHLVVPPPPLPITQTPASLTIVGPNHGLRGQYVNAVGQAPQACPMEYDTEGNPSINCTDVAVSLVLQDLTDPVPYTYTLLVGGNYVNKSTVAIDDQGHYTGSLWLKDYITSTTANYPWGTYNLCVVSDYQRLFYGYEPPEVLPGGYLAASAADSSAGTRPQLLPTPTPVYKIPGQGTGESPAAKQYWVSHYKKILACQPFTVDVPPRYQATYRMMSGGSPVPALTNPRLVVRGQATGYLTGTVPLKVRDTFVIANPAVGAPVSEPEGNLWVDAFACNYLPKIGTMAYNYGRGGVVPNTIDLEMTSTPFNGPTPRGVVTDFPTALTSQGKLGPFLSFANSQNGAPAVTVPFNIYFDNTIEVVKQVTVTLPTGAQVMATHTGTDPVDATRDVWSISLNVSAFPAGQVTTTVQALGHFKVSGCPVGEYPGAPWPVAIVMVPAPAWLNKPLASPVVTFDPVTNKYTMSGTVGQGVPGVDNWTIAPGGIPLDYLGQISNQITAQVDVNEVFSINEGSWKATAQIHGKSDVLCFPGDTKCMQNYAQPLAMAPPSAAITAPESPSMPGKYTWNGQTSLNKYGPWTVYNGIIASYWGIVNVNLSISFGATSQALMEATFVSDLNPSPLKIIPQATLEGDISLWVDVLMGVATAGVSGKPYLTVAMPVDIVNTTVSYGGPDICFGLRGEVWASMLFWKATFGPFDIFQTGVCYGAAEALSAVISTPPPSTLPAPSLASDGYGHLLGTWIHNSSNNPQQNVGVMYYVYWDGASWSEGQPAGVNDASFLMTDPEVAFAGPGKAVAVFASNSPNATQPITWSQVMNQAGGQQIAYSIFNGSTWTAKTALTNGLGPSGRVTLAGDPFHGEAMAAWVHDVSLPSKKNWIIENARFIASSGTWVGPSVVVTQSIPGVLSAEPNLAYNSIGEAALVWVSQRGAGASSTITTPFNTNSTRTLGMLRWSPSAQSWNFMGGGANFPAGVLMPSVAFDVNDKPLVAYTIYDKDQGGANTGFGNNNLLGYGILTGTTWVTKTHGSVLGVERPRMIPLKADLAVILYRGFGAVHTPEFGGAPMAVTINPLKPADAPSSPGLLTKVPGWLFAGASTGAPGQTGSLAAMGLYNLSTQTPTATMSAASLMPAMNATGRSGTGPMSLSSDAVMLMNVPVNPDAAIQPADFQVGDSLPISGTVVPVTVTVSNLGLAPTTLPVLTRVILDEGWPAETELYSATVPTDLIFMETYTVVTSWHATGGVHKLTARVYPQPSQDLDAENNAVEYIVGTPAPPANLTVSLSAYEPAVGLVWLPSPGSAISGYVIYRATYTNTLAPVGWTYDRAYVDRDVIAAVPYRYAVASFTGAGIESVTGVEVRVTVPSPIYLPIVMRLKATVE